VFEKMLPLLLHTSPDTDEVPTPQVGADGLVVNLVKGPLFDVDNGSPTK
jgi:hypothetical protein